MVAQYRFNDIPEDPWSSGYRAPNSWSTRDNKRNYTPSPSMNRASPQDAENQRFAGLHLLDTAKTQGTGAYALMHLVPKIASSMVHAINSGDAERTEKYGVELDELYKGSADDIDRWSAYTGGGEDTTGLVTQLSSMGKILSLGTWKVDPNALARLTQVSLAGPGPQNNPRGQEVSVSPAKSYNDVINKNSEENIAGRSLELREVYGVSPLNASMLANINEGNAQIRGLYNEYTSQAKVAQDSKRFDLVSVLKSQISVLDQMFDIVKEENLYDGKDPVKSTEAVNMIRMFMTPTVGGGNDSAIPNLNSFRRCVKNYVGSGSAHHDAVTFARRWQESTTSAGKNIDVRRKVIGDTAVDVPEDVTSRQDIAIADAVLNLLDDDKYGGHDRFSKATTQAVNKTLMDFRKLGILVNGATPQTEGLVSMAAAVTDYNLRDGVATDADGVARFNRWVGFYEQVNGALGLESTEEAKNTSTQPEESPGRGAPPRDTSPVDLSTIGQRRTMFDPMEQQLSKSLASKFVQALASDKKGVITRDKVKQIIAQSEDSMIQRLKQLSNPGEPPATDILADYYYPRLTGDYSDGNGGQIPAYKTLSDFVNGYIRKTHRTGADGGLTPIQTGPEAPQLVFERDEDGYPKIPVAVADKISKTMSDYIPEGIVGDDTMGDLSIYFNTFAGDKQGTRHYPKDLRNQDLQVRGFNCLVDVVSEDMGWSKLKDLKVGDRVTDSVATLESLTKEVIQDTKPGSVDYHKKLAVLSDLRDLCNSLSDNVREGRLASTPAILTGGASAGFQGDPRRLNLFGFSKPYEWGRGPIAKDVLYPEGMAPSAYSIIRKFGLDKSHMEEVGVKVFSELQRRGVEKHRTDFLNEQAQRLSTHADPVVRAWNRLAQERLDPGDGKDIVLRTALDHGKTLESKFPGAFKSDVFANDMLRLYHDRVAPLSDRSVIASVTDDFVESIKSRAPFFMMRNVSDGTIIPPGQKGAQMYDPKNTYIDYIIVDDVPQWIKDTYLKGSSVSSDEERKIIDMLSTLQGGWARRYAEERAREEKVKLAGQLEEVKQE